MTEYRWHIFLANLDPVVGSEQGKTRRVLVISEEEINQLLSVLNVLPITSIKDGRKVYPKKFGDRRNFRLIHRRFPCNLYLSPVGCMVCFVIIHHS